MTTTAVHRHVTGLQGQLTDREFGQFRALMYSLAGISLSDAKKQLVAGRLARRLRQLDLDGYGSYLKRVQADADERQIAVDLLTTNET